MQNRKNILIFVFWIFLFIPNLLTDASAKNWLMLPISAFLFWPLTLTRPTLALTWFAMTLVGLVNIFHFGFFGTMADEFFIATTLRTTHSEAWEFVQTLPSAFIFYGLIWTLLCIATLRMLWRHRAQQQRYSTTELYTCSAAACVWLVLVVWPFAKGMDTLQMVEKTERVYPSHFLKASLRHHQMSQDLFYSPVIANNVSASENIKTIVVVLGESGTAQRWSLLGYEGADTNLPLKDKPGISVWNVRAQGPNTASALPFMLTGKSAQESVSQKSPSFIDIARHAGYKTFVFNNSRFYSETEDFYSWVLRRSADTYMKAGDGDLDEVLTPHLKAALQNPSPRKLIVLHTYGSHPKVEKRFPPEAAHWADPYDNSIRYTSELLAEWLELTNQSTVESALFLYASDHGLMLPPANPPYRLGHSESTFQVPLLYWSNTAANAHMSLSSLNAGSQQVANTPLSNALLAELAVQAMGHSDGIKPTTQLYATK